MSCITQCIKIIFLSPNELLCFQAPAIAISFIGLSEHRALVEELPSGPVGKYAWLQCQTM